MIQSQIGPELPLLRRYARAVTGSQSLGDGAVRETLEAVLEDPEIFGGDEHPRLRLYRLFHKLWPAESVAQIASSGLVHKLSARARQSLLLTAVEGFTTEETAFILSISPAEVKGDLEQARRTINELLRADILVIEDEAVIALHIKSIIQQAGHNPVGVATTHSEAVEMTRRTNPELILADISLADGSSGVDAVKEILETADVPVIFVTAFPERLLTGERPEPTYLITKPFEPEMLTATIVQALMFHREQAALEVAE